MNKELKDKMFERIANHMNLAASSISSWPKIIGYHEAAKSCTNIASEQSREDAIAFSDWKDICYHRYLSTNMFCATGELLRLGKDCPMYTTSQLYDLYIEQKNKKHDEE